ncbi:sensor histidine kinase [Paenibacillus thalictri]|uniref:Sensor histidine kinase n=1 Tax=Paenibacillus thalictri TaxID=2527873 RepID=A0A4Q9DTU1_9BACL|nr:sensor histidine kinase [Paenibacillus thalictri]TBL79756.1 sensor histidine kinase [Paenibacillus thalictri]
MRSWAKLPSFIHITQSVRAKLVLFLLAMAILPLVALGYFSYHKSAQIVNTQFGSYGLYAVEQLKQHLDTSLKQMDSITGNILTYLISSPIVIEDQEPRTYNQYAEEKNFKRFLASFENMSILSVNVITPSGKLIGNDAINADKLFQSPFWAGVLQKNGKRIVIQKPNYYSSTSVDYVISLIVPIKNSFGIPTGSNILIDMRADAILGLFRTFEYDTKAHLQIRDMDGHVVLQTSSDDTPKDNDIVWSKKLETEQWVVEARMPYSRFYESSGIILKYTLLAAVVTVVIGAAMAAFFSYRFTRPIKNLSHSMKRFGQGELSIQTPVHTSDEFGYLSEAFNRMTGQIKDLIEEISLKEKQKSDAELKALHYQINPHLLFNTLNSIQWKARLAHQTDIQKMLQHLVVVLEGSFNVSQVLVPLHKELDIALHYLEIQKYRFGDEFTFHFDVQPGLEECLIPRMVLQPLLENIFFHGFVDGKGHIGMNIVSTGNWLEIELTDNGMGIRPEHLSYITSGRKIPGKKGGLGMRNVDERFKLHFGENCGLHVESQRNQGTKVVMKWPKTV